MEECGRGVSATVRAAQCPMRVMLIKLLGRQPVSAPAWRRNSLEIRVVQVWRARCKQTSEIVAIKVMDLENVNCSLVRCFTAPQGCRNTHLGHSSCCTD